jgi:nucleotide-binding universal stress UspA family protein
MATEGWTVLAGVDGSARAREAAAFAAQLSAAVGGRLVLGCAYSYRTVGGRLGSGDQARALLRAAAGELAQPCATRIVPARSPSEGLRHLAEITGAHLVVLGSRHRGRLGEALPGATTRELLHDGRWAVAIVPGAHHVRDLRHLGVLTDATAAGRAALLAAGLIASDTGAELRVQGLPRGPHDEAPRAPVTEDLARGRLDLLVVAARPHNLLGRLRRQAATGAIPARSACPVIVVPAAARLPVAQEAAAATPR